MTGRWPSTLLAIVGALLAGLSAQATGSQLASIGWAVTAGVGLSLLLRGFGLRVVGIALALVSVGGIAWSVQASQWIVFCGLALSLVASAGFVIWGPSRWHRQHTRTDAPADLWQTMDEGVDPTEEPSSPLPSH